MSEKKACSKCNQDLAFEHFSKKKSGKFGLDSKCKQCRKAYCTVWYENNREYAVSQAREWSSKNPQKRKEIRDKWRTENPEIARALTADWAKRNPEARRAIDHRRRARKLQAGGNASKHDILSLFERQRGKCACCRTSIEDGYEIDHVVALAAGGSNDMINLQLLCMLCNRSKGSKDPVDFMQSRGFLL